MDEADQMIDAFMGGDLPQDVADGQFGLERSDSFSLAFDQFTGAGDGGGPAREMSGSSREFFLHALGRNAAHKSGNRRVAMPGSEHESSHQTRPDRKLSQMSGRSSDRDKEEDPLFKF